MMKRAQILAFILLWLTYFLCYCLRKPLGIYKLYIESEFHLSEADLGWTDVALLLPYSVVQIAGSSIWDTFRPGHVIALNLSLASLAMLSTALTHEYSLFCLCVAVSGAAQAPLWPACVKIITTHFDDSSLGRVIGLLSTSPYAGATFSAALVSYITDHWGWRHSLLPLFVPCMIVSVLVLCLLRPGHKNSVSKAASNDSGHSYSKLLAINGVREVIAAGVCLKFGRYALYMWLPLFMTQSLEYDIITAGLLSSAFDIGGAIGGPLIGYWVDSTHEKLKTIYKATIVGMVAMAAFAFLGSVIDSISIAILLGVIGISFCGIDSVLIGAITAEMGNANGMNAGAGVTSLVNGVSSTGGIVEGPLLGMLVASFGWPSVMAAIVASALMATIALMKADYVTKTASSKKLVHQLSEVAIHSNK